MWQGKLNVLDLLEVSSWLALGISAFLVLIRIYFKDSALITLLMPLRNFVNKLLLETLMHFWAFSLIKNAGKNNFTSLQNILLFGF